MDLRDIKRLEMSTLEFGEVSMKAGQEGAQDDVDQAGNTEEKLSRVKASTAKVANPIKADAAPSKNHKKRALILKAAENLEALSDNDLRRIGAALMA